MKKFLKSLMKDKHHLVLTVLLSIFILFDVKIPLVFAELIDNPLGKIFVGAISLSLLSMNTIAGVVGLIAAFVLFQRSADATGSYARVKYLPTEHKKQKKLAAMNEFPITVEEEVISQMIPTTHFRDLTPPEFKPVLGDNHEAASVH